MARRGRPAPEEENVEDTEAMEATEEAAPAATEFVPEQTHKPKSDVYTLILVLTFVGHDHTHARSVPRGNDTRRTHSVEGRLRLTSPRTRTIRRCFSFRF